VEYLFARRATPQELLRPVFLVDEKR